MRESRSRPSDPTMGFLRSQISLTVWHGMPGGVQCVWGTNALYCEEPDIMRTTMGFKLSIYTRLVDLAGSVEPHITRLNPVIKCGQLNKHAIF